MKKVLAITLILVLLVGTLGLTACGEAKGANEIWIGVTNAGYGIEWLKQTIADFEAENPGYKVTIKEEGPLYTDQAGQQLSMPSTAKNDVYIIDEIWWKNDARKGFYKSLDAVYSAPFNDEMTIADAMRDENIAEALITDKDGGTHYYAINYASSAASFIYNKTIGDYYESLPGWGNNTPNMATIKDGGTVDQLVLWMKKVSELSKTYYNFNTGKPGYYMDDTTPITLKDGKPAVYPMVYPGLYQYWDHIISTWWAQYAGIDGYRQFYEYESPAVYADVARLHALRALEKMEVNKNSVPGSVGMTHIDAQNEFLRGRAALIPCGEWMYYESKTNADAWGTEFEMIYTPACCDDVPTNQRNYMHYSDGGLCVIPNNDKVNYDVAIKFLSYLFSEKGCLNYTTETGSMWGFDGTEDPNTTYATQIAEAGRFSTFNENVMNLVNNANAKVSSLPLNLNAPNAAFASTPTVAGQWPGVDLSKIREGTKSAEDIFYEIINIVGDESANHNSGSEWDKWWKIVHGTNA